MTKTGKNRTIVTQSLGKERPGCSADFLELMRNLETLMIGLVTCESEFKSHAPLEALSCAHKPEQSYDHKARHERKPKEFRGWFHQRD